jgi:hypothetical protein
VGTILDELEALYDVPRDRLESDVFAIPRIAGRLDFVFAGDEPTTYVRVPPDLLAVQGEAHVVRAVFVLHRLPGFAQVGVAPLRASEGVLRVTQACHHARILGAPGLQMLTERTRRARVHQLQYDDAITQGAALNERLRRLLEHG